MIREASACSPGTGGLASDCFGSKTRFAVLLPDACFAPHTRTRFAGGSASARGGLRDADAARCRLSRSAAPMTLVIHCGSLADKPANLVVNSTSWPRLVATAESSVVENGGSGRPLHRNTHY